MFNNLKSKKIGIDIDDVLSSTIPNLLQYLKEFHDINIEYDDFLHYRFYETRYFIERGIDLCKSHEIWNSFSHSNYGMNMDAIKGSRQTLKKLKERGFDLYLITARWEELRENTLVWLKQNYPEIEFSGLHFTGKFQGGGIKKSEICRLLGIELMIEDSAENVLDLAENGISSYLITRPWNKGYDINHPNIKRVSSWEDISC